MKRHHRRGMKRARKHYKRKIGFLEALRLLIGMPAA
jgi:hypothetical protein